MKLAVLDGTAYQRYMEAARRPPSERERSASMAAALHEATRIPLEIAEQANEAGRLLQKLVKYVKPKVQSDIYVGIRLVIGAAEAGLLTASTNVNVQPNQRLRASIYGRIRRATKRLEELKGLCYTPRPDRTGAQSASQASPRKVQKQTEWKSRSSTITSKKRSRSPRKN
jgi:glutamate formiminotransferase/glutamate formiminotransferase/formiminotetrahydrofolate cyclodeaminase